MDIQSGLRTDVALCIIRARLSPVILHEILAVDDLVVDFWVPEELIELVEVKFFIRGEVRESVHLRVKDRDEHLLAADLAETEGLAQD